MVTFWQTVAKAIPFFVFRLALNAFPEIASVSQIENKKTFKKNSQEVLE